MKIQKRIPSLVIFSVSVCMSIMACQPSLLNPPAWIQGTWADGSGYSWTFTGNDVIWITPGHSFDFDSAAFANDSSTPSTYAVVFTGYTYSFEIGDGTYITQTYPGTRVRFNRQ